MGSTQGLSSMRAVFAIIAFSAFVTVATSESAWEDVNTSPPIQEVLHQQQDTSTVPAANAESMFMDSNASPAEDFDEEPAELVTSQESMNTRWGYRSRRRARYTRRRARYTRRRARYTRRRASRSWWRRRKTWW